MKSETRIREYLEEKGHSPEDVDTKLRSASTSDYDTLRGHIMATLGEDIDNA